MSGEHIISEECTMVVSRGVQNRQARGTAWGPVAVSGADGSAVGEVELAADGVGAPMLGHQFSTSMTLCRFAGGIAGGVTPLVLLPYRPGTTYQQLCLAKHM